MFITLTTLLLVGATSGWMDGGIPGYTICFQIEPLHVYGSYKVPWKFSISSRGNQLLWMNLDIKQYYIAYVCSFHQCIGTVWLLDLFHPLILPLTSSYFFLPLSSFGMVWGYSCDIGDWDNWIWSFDLYIVLMLKSCEVVVVVHLDYKVSSGPFLSYEIEIGDGPGPELDNFRKFLKS